MTDGLEDQKECEEKRCHPANSAELIGQRSTRAGFKRVARHVCQLHFNCDQLHSSCDPEDLALLIPRLLYVAAKHSPQLEGVELAVPLTPSPFSKALQVGLMWLLMRSVLALDVACLDLRITSSAKQRPGVELAVSLAGAQAC